MLTRRQSAAAPLLSALALFLAPVADAGLIARYQFEGGFADSTGNGHTAVPVGSGSLVNDPERGNVYYNPTTTSPRSYLNIDGTVAIPNLPANAGLTLAVWVRRDIYTARGTVTTGNLVAALSLGTGGDAPIASIGVNNSGAIFSYIEGDGAADQVTLSSANGLVTNEVWTHLAVTFDRANNVGKLYLNGVQTGSNFDISLVGDGELNWAGANIGTLAAPGNANWDFQGHIDDARIYDEVLSESQIAALAAMRTDAVEVKLEIERVGSDLVLNWNSRSGKWYDLLSAADLSVPAAAWPVWNDGIHPPYQNIAATPGENSLTIPLPGDPRRFFVVVEKDPPPLLDEDFEGGLPGTWSTSDNGAGTAWSVGVPNGTGTGPDAAAGGTQCAGTNMNADYTDSAAASLVSPAFTVPAGGATLKFSQYIDTELPSGGGDFGSIRLLNAADNTPLTGGGVTGNLEGVSGTWTNQSIILPAAANGLQVKIEFLFQSDDDGQNFAGFHIDDVVVTVN